MDTGTHPDPFGEALQHTRHRAMQLVSAAATAAQVYAFHYRSQARVVAERDERGRRALTTAIRAETEAARAGWAPALDPAWLRQATFLQVARAWGAAVPHADRAVPWYEPAAATALRKCEERLRELHPYAMARYDRLRAEGMSAAEAMTHAAPLFARPPHARDASSAPRPMLESGERHAPGPVPPASPQAPGGRGEGPGAGLVRAEEDRAASAERLRASDLDAATDLTVTHSVDERTVNLTGAHDAATTASAAAARAKRAARPWERDFPTPIRDVLAAVSRQGTAPTASPAAPHNRARRPAPTRGRQS